MLQEKTRKGGKEKERKKTPFQRLNARAQPTDPCSHARRPDLCRGISRTIARRIRGARPTSRCFIASERISRYSSPRPRHAATRRPLIFSPGEPCCNSFPARGKIYSGARYQARGRIPRFARRGEFAGWPARPPSSPPTACCRKRRDRSAFGMFWSSRDSRRDVPRTPMGASGGVKQLRFQTPDAYP